MNEELPRSLSRFAGELERALRRELGLDRAHSARRRLWAHPRLLAGTTFGVAGAGTALALVLAAASSPPAFAVTRNHDGTYTVSLRYIGAIPTANKRLAGMRLRAAIVQVESGCRAPWSVSISRADERRYLQHWRRTVRAASAARIDPHQIPPGAKVVIPAWRIGHEVRMAQGVTVRGVTISGPAPACMPPYPPPPCPPPPHARRDTQVEVGPLTGPGNSGNSGLAVPGNSGNSGGNGSWTLSAAPGGVPSGKSGNSGNSGNSGPPPAGNSGNSGNSGGFTYKLHGRPGEVAAVSCTIHHPGTPPPGGSSGNSGNSGNSGSSGNS